MLDIVIVAACLCLNAFFSAYEMAFVTVSKEDMQDLSDNSPALLGRLKRFKRRPERTLSVIQIGITLVGAIAAAVGGTGAVENLEPYFVERFQMSRSLAEGISVAMVIIPLTYFSVVFGELLPKSIALKHPLRVIRAGTTVLSRVDQMIAPVVTLLERSTNWLLEKTGLSEQSREREELTVDIGSLPLYHRQFVLNLIALKNRRVQKSMLPWDKVVRVDFADSAQSARDKIDSAPNSRFPVVDQGEAVGLLLKKEFYGVASLDVPDPWQSILRPVVKVSENDKVLEALLLMQEKQTPLAVVLDEEKRLSGIITIEDILEEIVGDIDDRSDYSPIFHMLSKRPKMGFTSKKKRT